MDIKLIFLLSYFLIFGENYTSGRVLNAKQSIITTEDDSQCFIYDIKLLNWNEIGNQKPRTTWIIYSSEKIEEIEQWKINSSGTSRISRINEALTDGFIIEQHDKQKNQFKISFDFNKITKEDKTYFSFKNTCNKTVQTNEFSYYAVKGETPRPASLYKLTIKDGILTIYCRIESRHPLNNSIILIDGIKKYDIVPESSTNEINVYYINFIFEYLPNVRHNITVITIDETGNTSKASIFFGMNSVTIQSDASGLTYHSSTTSLSTIIIGIVLLIIIIILLLLALGILLYKHLSRSGYSIQQLNEGTAAYSQSNGVTATTPILNGQER